VYQLARIYFSALFQHHDSPCWRVVGAPLFISIAFGDRIALDGAPRFISISFGGRMVLVGALLIYVGIPLKIHKI
jgi:hypothetical protein